MKETLYICYQYYYVGFSRSAIEMYATVPSAHKKINILLRDHGVKSAALGFNEILTSREYFHESLTLE